MTIRAAIYARVSKGEDQHKDTQLIELHEWANRLGYKVEEFVDEESSRDRRPRKEELLRRARIGEFNVIAFVRLDRWGRSMDELVLELQEFHRRKVTLVSLREGLHFDDAAGVLFAHLLAAFANFERDLIKERTIAGLSRAKSEGQIAGRHPAGCGCGARPEGKPPHDGPVKVVRDGKRPVKWVFPNGAELPIKSNPPRPDGGVATSEPVAGG